jgi:uncharacterized membrane protein YkoI
MKKFVKIGVTLAALSSFGALAAYAAKPQENDALITYHAAISLTQAVQTAEQHVHGQAVQAELEHGKQGWVYDVEVVSGTSVYDVAVDADKGTVLASQLDKADHDDAQDKED